MDRLTAKDIVAGVEIFDLKAGICEEKAFNLLGQYEQTGLTPAEVDRLQQENKQLKELLRLAVEDLKIDRNCSMCITYCNFDGNCVGISMCGQGRPNWQWQHADKLKELEVISHD